ncbi:MAG TPA: PAS domain-containing sensor histidine kinase, partial [Pontibacter sp.]
MPLPQNSNYSPDTPPAFFEGGGEMGELIRAYNWAGHPLGTPDGWPQSLKTAVRMLLHSGFPMFLWWSDSFYMFHNDAYLPALGNKHPRALGAKAEHMWAEIWNQIGAIAHDIYKNGSQFYAEDMPIYLDRKGFIEETYWTFSYSPAFGDDGSVAGVFCACKEVSATVINQRRLKTLKDVTEALTQVHTLEEACRHACAVMSENSSDIPLCSIYLLDDSKSAAHLLGKSGILLSEALPDMIRFEEKEEGNPFRKVMETRQPVLVKYKDLITEHGKLDEELQQMQVALLPIALNSQGFAAGFIAAGISPKLSYDTNYQDFHLLLVRQLAISFASVNARYETERRQAYLNEIFQQAPVGITILRGPDYVVDLANPGVCEIWGKKYEEV